MSKMALQARSPHTEWLGRDASRWQRARRPVQWGFAWWRGWHGLCHNTRWVSTRRTFRSTISSHPGRQRNRKPLNPNPTESDLNRAASPFPSANSNEISVSRSVKSDRETRNNAMSCSLESPTHLRRTAAEICVVYWGIGVRCHNPPFWAVHSDLSFQQDAQHIILARHNLRWNGSWW